MSAPASPVRSPEHEFGEALILLSQLERKRKSHELLASSSETDEMVGSGDEGHYSEGLDPKKIKLPPCSSLPIMNIKRLVHADAEIVHVQTKPIPSEDSKPIPSWMDRYNNVRKSINIAVYPLPDDVQWLNEQIEEMRKKTLSPERTELLKQAMNIISFNFKSQPSNVQNRTALSAFPPAVLLSSSSDSFDSPPSSPENNYGNLIQGNRKMKRNQLSSWMCTQRQDKKSGELPEYRIKLLDIIGFVWSKQHKQKQQQAKSNGTFEMEKNPKDAENDVLNSNHVISLNGRAKRNHDLWMIRYRELIQFKKRYGHLKVPTLVPEDE